MKPTNDADDALVDLVDVILRDGAIVEADAVITVADVPLVGLKLRAAIAGMTTMTEYGMLLDMDERARRRVEGDSADRRTRTERERREMSDRPDIGSGGDDESDDPADG